jgi:mRNA interferase MazF
VWLEFDPQAGHEQAGRRPALVLSPASYNARVGLALVCPITPHVKGYPFEVVLPASGRLRGAVLADQVKSLDWRMRRAQRLGRVPPDLLEQVIARIETLLRG